MSRPRDQMAVICWRHCGTLFSASSSLFSRSLPACLSLLKTCICTLTQSHTHTLPHNAYHLYLLLWFNQRNSRQRFLLLILDSLYSRQRFLLLILDYLLVSLPLTIQQSGLTCQTKLNACMCTSATLSFCRAIWIASLVLIFSLIAHIFSPSNRHSHWLCTHCLSHSHCLRACSLSRIDILTDCSHIISLESTFELIVHTLPLSYWYSHWLHTYYLLLFD
jgi:hypothetical protein